MLEVWPPVPLFLEAVERLTDDVGLIDRVDRAPGPPVRLLDADVTRAARDGDRRQEGATARDRDVEQSGLRDDAGVGAHAVVDRGDPTGTRGLFVGDGADDDVARQPQAKRNHNFGGEDHRGYTALHVDGAAAVEVALAYLGLEGVTRPFFAGVRRDHVDVAVQEEAPTISYPREPGCHLRATVEAKSGRDETAPVHVLGRWFPHFGLGARSPQAPGQVLLEIG